MKKKILLGLIIAIGSLQTLGGLTGIDNLSKEPCRVRILLKSGKTTPWRYLKANPKAKKDQRGSKTVFNNINSKNVRIQWMQNLDLGPITLNFKFKTPEIIDARDIYIHDDGRCEAYEWNVGIIGRAIWPNITEEFNGKKVLDLLNKLRQILRNPGSDRNKNLYTIIKEQIKTIKPLPRTIGTINIVQP